ncbi:unnamed protein product [Rotaria sp. Silwood2]|nr:unnamed protein product [Rotaria sp. Silwood2]
MGLCLANSLISRRDFVPYDQLVRYKWWYRHGYMSSTGQCFDIGSATSQSLGEFERRQQLFAAKNHIPLDELDFLSESDLLTKFDVYCSEIGVAGNGALMRLAPVPLFFYRHPVDAVEFSGFSGAITHGDPKAYDACRYYGALIVAALRGENKTQLLDNNFYLNHISWFNNKPLTEEIMNVAQGSYKKPGGYADGIRGKGYIVSSLEAALWAFCYDENSFEKGVLDVINLGDDTDTTAAIYGQLAGAYYGYDKLPEKWVKQVYAHSFITCLSKWIVYEGELWQPKAPIPNGSGLSSQYHLNVIPHPAATSSSVSDTSPTDTYTPISQFNSLFSSEPILKESIRSSEVTLNSIQGAPLQAQSSRNSSPRATVLSNGYKCRTRSANSDTKNFDFNNVTSSRYDRPTEYCCSDVPAFWTGIAIIISCSDAPVFRSSIIIPISCNGSAAGLQCDCRDPNQESQPAGHNTSSNASRRSQT